MQSPRGVLWKGVFENFAKIHKKTPVSEGSNLIKRETSTKVASLACNSIEKETSTQVFLWILRNF